MNAANARTEHKASRISPEDMRIFVAVGESRTLTEAASALQLPLSTVSRALKRIETEGQLALVKRGRDALQLTETGREYLRACRSVLEAHAAATDVLNAQRQEPEGTLRIAVPSLFGRFVLPDIVPEFQRRFRQLKIEIELYSSDWNQKPKLTHDVFLKVRTPNDSSHHLKIFPAIRQGLFASPAYLAASGEPSHPSALEEHTCLGYEHEGEMAAWSLSSESERLTVRPDFSVVVHDPEILARLATHGAGIAQLPLWLAHPYLAGKQLVRIFPGWTSDPVVFCALYNGRPRNASKEGAFLQFLGSVLGTGNDPRSQGEDPNRFFVRHY